MFWPVQTIALKLLQSCVEDGSPLVRRELVVALQWVLLTFLPNFINLLKALQVAPSVMKKSFVNTIFGSYGQMSLVADPDPRYGAFLTTGYGIRDVSKSGSGSGMNNLD
jgi:hypothetical protein